MIGLMFPRSPLKVLPAFSLPRLLEFVGSGRTSVSHARGLAEIYDSDIITSLGFVKIPIQFHANIDSKFSTLEVSYMSLNPHVF